MRTLLLDLLLSVVIVLVIWSAALAETQYETFEYTTIPDVTRPSLHTDDRGTFETYKYTTIPDVSKPVYAPMNPATYQGSSQSGASSFGSFPPLGGSR